MSSSSKLKEQERLVVTEEDLEHLCHLVDRKDGGPPWKHIMDRSAPGMRYQAWQRDPEVRFPHFDEVCCKFIIAQLIICMLKLFGLISFAEVSNILSLSNFFSLFC